MGQSSSGQASALRGGGGSTIFEQIALGRLVGSSPPTPVPYASPSGLVSVTNLFAISEPPDKAVAMVVNLVPPLSSNGSQGEYYGFEMQPQLGLFARVRWGSQNSPAQIEVDFAQGISFPIWTSFISVDAINELASPGANATPPNVSAFVSPGNYTLGTPRRTKQAMQLGVPVSAAAPLMPGDESDLTPIALFSQSLTVAVSPFSVTSSGAPFPFGITFWDASGTIIVGSVLLTSVANNAAVIPSDAKYVSITNIAPGGNPLNSVRFVFAIGA